MRADARGVAAALALGAAAASIGYAAFAATRTSAFGRRARRATLWDWRVDDMGLRRPLATVLKPVRGFEPGLEENLRSFCEQDYPAAFEVVFGVREPNDPALAVIRRVAAAFPDRAKVVVGDGVAVFRNPKMATLAPMLGAARGELLLIADSDMRVTPSYLRTVVAAFYDERVGAATCVYRGEPAAPGLASALGAMWISEQFAPSALVATALEPLTYCFGATMAVRRDVLDAIGGLGALGDHLADDHRLGQLVAARGYRVALAPYVVANAVAEPNVRALFAHELRWARTIRTVRPASYPGIALTYPIPLALLHALLARDRRRALAVLALAVIARFALHRTANDGLAVAKRPSPLLIPVRDFLGVAVWAAGMAGRDVRWRDEALRITPAGDLAAR